MAKAITIGVDMPADFPGERYNSIHQLVVEHGRLGKRYAEQWGAAWRAVALRFLAADHYEMGFSHSMAQHGTAPEHVLRADQERMLFGFFTNARSVFDCFGYAMYVWLASRDVSGFQLRTVTDQKRVNLNDTVRALDRALPRDPLTKGFRRVWRSRAFNELSAIRHYLSHRSTPPRHFYLATAGGETSPDLWRMRLHGIANVPLEPDTIRLRRQATTQALALLTSRFHDYVLRTT